MAIKTVVCPECRAPAAPGRYACARCGALLASVALSSAAHGRSAPDAPADPSPGASSINGVSGDPIVDHGPSSAGPVAPAWTHALAAVPEDEPLPEPREDERWDDELPIATPVAASGAPEPVSTPPVDEPAGAALADAPDPQPVAVPEPVAAPDPVAASVVITAASPTAKPRTRSGTRASRRPDVRALEEIAPLKQPDPRPVLASAPDAEPAPAEPPTPAEPALLAVAPPAVMQPEAAPAWPPPGDQGIIVQPPARAPAGSYLPPSAVLPSAEALVAGAIGRVADPNAHVIPARSEVGAPGPAPADRLAQLGLPADSPRRVVGVGAVIASLGFLLPWAAVLAGSGLLGGYLTQWGLAGPGHWIVALLLVGLAVVALAGGRLASVPVGLPAVAIATLLTGLAWPYLFGFLGRAVGIWVVLFGAILMVSGGLLDLKATRHAEPDSSV